MERLRRLMMGDGGSREASLALFRDDCRPVGVLRRMVEEHGHEEGLRRLVEMVVKGLEVYVEDHVDQREFDQDRAKAFLDRMCLWLEHVICCNHVLNVLQDGASFTESSAICKQKIKLSADNEPQRVCSRAFRAGDIVWNCKQCQMDSTCVLCQQCFRDSDHEGHDVYFYHVVTDSGGCCDCGDARAWDPKGFCTRHGEKSSSDSTLNDDPRKWLPDDQAGNAKLIFDRLFAVIAKLSTCGHGELVLKPNAETLNAAVLEKPEYDEEVAQYREYLTYHAQWKLRPRGAREEIPIPLSLKSWFQQVEDKIRMNQDISEEDLVLTSVSFENLEQCLFVAGGYRPRYYRVIVKNLRSIRISFVIQHLTQWILNDLCHDSDAFSRIACHALTESVHYPSTKLMPLQTLIVRDLELPDSSSKSLRNLYIRLLVDSLFKERFAVAFALAYRDSCLARVKRQAVLELSDLDTVFGLSVQFLNRHNHVLQLVHEHGFLSSVLESLLVAIRACQVPSHRNHNKLELNLFNPILTHRKTKCIITDFTYVLNTPGMSKLLLMETSKTYLAIWFNVLSTVRGMHEQYRRHENQIPERDEKWIPAFNLSLSLMSLFCDMTRYLVNGETLADIVDECKYAEMLYESQQQHEQQQRENHIDWCDSLINFCKSRLSEIMMSSKSMVVDVRSALFGTQPYIPYDVFKQPISLHCLPQRFFGMITSLCISSTLTPVEYERLLGFDPNDLATRDFYLALIRQPLNALLLTAQTHAGLWKRNQDMAAQTINYQSLPFISGMQMDIRVIQIAAAVLPPDTVVHYFVRAFGVMDYIAKGALSEKSNQDNVELQDELIKKHRLELEMEQKAMNEKLTEIMLEYLIVLMTELPQITPFALKRANEDFVQKMDDMSLQILRREVIHCLAVKKCTFSMISEHCSHLRHFGIKANTTAIRKVVHEVATEVQRPDGLGALQFELKQHPWAEFDPLFHRLARNERDQARERWIHHRASTRIVEKPCFPGDAKKKTVAHRYEPLPATAWHGNIHPGFRTVRENFLCDSKALIVLCRQLLLKASFTHPNNASTIQPFSGNLLFNVIHMLTLQLHVYRNNCKDRDTCQGFFGMIRERGDGEDGKSILDCLLTIWYDKFRVDPVNRESIRWLLWQINDLDPASREIMKSANKNNKSSLQSEKEKMSRKRKAQRHAMNVMKQSQDLAFRLFAKEMDPENGSIEGGGSGGAASSASGSSAASRQLADTDSLGNVVDGNQTPKSGATRSTTSTRSDKSKSSTSSLARQFVLPLPGRHLAGEEVDVDDMKRTKQRKQDREASREIEDLESSTKASISLSNDGSGASIPTSFPAIPPAGGGISPLNRALYDDDNNSYVGPNSATSSPCVALSPEEEWLKQCEKTVKKWKGPECVSCHERHGLDEDGTFYIAYRQQNDALIRKKESTTANGYCVHWPSEDSRNCVIQLCGHAIHKTCLQQYRSSIQSLPMNALDTNRDEFLCPLCKTLSNFEIPCVPSMPVYGGDQESVETGVRGGGSDPMATCSEEKVFLDDIYDWFGKFSETKFLEEQQEQQRSLNDLTVEACTKHLNSLTESFNHMMDFYYKQSKTAQLNAPFRRQGLMHPHHHHHHGNEETMVLFENNPGEMPRPQFTRDPITFMFSFAFTVISEHEALLSAASDPFNIGKVSKDGSNGGVVVPYNLMRKITHMFEACRANLHVNDGTCLKHLTSELYELLANERTVDRHCILRLSPEMLLILSILSDCSRENMRLSIRSLYVLKLVQTLLDIRGDEGHHDETMDDGDDTSIIPDPFMMTLNELRVIILTKFDENDQTQLHSDRSWTPGAKEMLVRSLTKFIHIAHLLIFVARNPQTPQDNNHSRNEQLTLTSVDYANLPIILGDMDLPTPNQLVQQGRFGILISEWVDQAQACGPKWIPRALMSKLGHVSSSSSEKELTAKTTPTPSSKKEHDTVLMPLTFRPLINLTRSYTEQYVEVHEGLCSECKEPAHDRAICLICGEILIAGVCSRGREIRTVEQRGACTRHMEECHNGIGVVLLFRRSSSVLLINRANSAYWGSLYVDKNGDDQHVIPSLPMFLDKKRYARVERLWRESLIPATIANLRNAANVVIRRNYY